MEPINNLEKICQGCGITYIPGAKHMGKFCTHKCCTESRKYKGPLKQCLKCGIDIKVNCGPTQYLKKKYCSARCCNQMHEPDPTKSAYKQIVVNPGERKSMPYHRYVMEQHLGRKLEKNLVVHHINGNKYDNRLENLQVLDRATHTSLHHSELPKSKVCIICGRVFSTRRNNRAIVQTCGKACHSFNLKKKWKERCPRFDEKDIYGIKLFSRLGVSQSKIAKLYNTSQDTIWRVLRSRGVYATT